MARAKSLAARIRAARAQVALDRKIGRESTEWVVQLAQTTIPSRLVEATVNEHAEATTGARVIDPPLEEVAQSTPEDVSSGDNVRLRSSSAGASEIEQAAPQAVGPQRSRPSEHGEKVDLLEQFVQQSGESISAVIREASVSDAEIVRVHPGYDDEDIFHDVLGSLAKLPVARLRDFEQLERYALATARRYAMDRARRMASSRAWFDRPTPESASEAAAEGEEELQLNDIADALKNLSPKENEILDLIFFQGMTNSEVAERLGISYAAVVTRRHRAIQRLRSPSSAGPGDE